MNYLEIQKTVIEKYKIVIVEHSTCRQRTHAHCDGTRRICKWNQANSFASTFTLLHEIGHIMTYTSKMRRCESEYFATIWAIERCKEYGLKVTPKIIQKYNNYIEDELYRGIKRGGINYREEYDITNYDPSEIKELPIKEPKLPKGRVI